MVGDANENRALRRQFLAGGNVGFGEGFAEIVGDAHDFSGGAHFGAENRVDAGKFRPGKDRRFHVEAAARVQFCASLDVLWEDLAQLAAGHEARGNLGQGYARSFGNEGHGAGGARVDFQHVNLAVAAGCVAAGLRPVRTSGDARPHISSIAYMRTARNRELHVHQADHFEGARQPESVFAHALEQRLGNVDRWQHAGRVAGVDAGFLDVLHDAADYDVLSIGERVHIDFNRVFQKFIDEDGAVLRILDGLLHILHDRVVVVEVNHGSPSEDIRRTNQHRESDFLRGFDRLFDRGDHGSGGLRDVEFFEKFSETLAVFGQIDRFGRGADDVDACSLEGQRKIQRRLTAELHDHADGRAAGCFVLADGEHIFEGERLEVEAVAGVVVGGDRLRIAVDHDGFVAILTQRVGGVAAAVIEFNSLPDAVGAGTENDDLLLRRGRRFVFFFVSGVEIWSVAFELRGAGIDPLVDRLQAVLLAEVADFFLAAFAVQAPGPGETSIGETHALGFAQHLGRDRFHRVLFQLQLHVVNLFELVEEPGIDRGHLRNLLDRVPLTDGVLHVGQALGMRRDQALRENFGFDFLRPHALARIERTNSLLQGF